MRKIAVVVTARPSYARVQTVLEGLTRYPVDVGVIMAGSALLHHYGTVIDDCPFPVKHRVYSTLQGSTLETTAQETGLLVIHLARIFAEDRPDLVVTIADRHETLATALAASYQHVPLAHIQGGERTGSIDDKVRDAVSKLSDLHFPATDMAAVRVRSMGVRGDVWNFGCPSVDLAARAVANPDDAETIVVLQHPVTNEYDEARSQIEATYAAIGAFPGHPVVWFWPGQDAGTESTAKFLRERRDRADHPRLVFRRHAPAVEFLSLLRGCACLVGNSSVGIRESVYLGTPVVDIGTRQEGREHGANVVHCGYSEAAIAEAIRGQLAHGRYPRSTLYGDGHAGSRIAGVLASVGRRTSAERERWRTGQEHSYVRGWRVLA